MATSCELERPTYPPPRSAFRFLVVWPGGETGTALSAAPVRAAGAPPFGGETAAAAGCLKWPGGAPLDHHYLDLLDWRRRVAEQFAALRRRPATAETLAWFRAEKDRLVGTHPQSPIPVGQRATFPGLAYWPFDPAARVEARFQPEVAEPNPADVPLSGPDTMRLARIGTLGFTLFGQPLALGAFWVMGYAGGLFVPFRDSTSGRETYGAGRYLLDTIKSADLGPGSAPGTVVLDFNYAYHPSCAFDPRWVCPLAPRENWLPLPIRAGERMGHA